MSRKMWIEDEYTQELIKECKASLDQLVEAWKAGTFTHPTAEGTAQLNSKALGQIQSLESILEYIHRGRIG